MVEDGSAHARGGDDVARGAWGGDVGRAVAGGDGGGDGFLDGTGLELEGERVAQEHGGGEAGGDGVGGARASDVGGGAVDGLVDAAAAVAEGGARTEAEGAREDRGLVGED